MSDPAGLPTAEPLFRPHEVRSLRDRAYDDIRDAILMGALKPGQRIKERDVAAEMGISTTPVKEALRRLEQEGLVVSQPRRGAVVGPLVLTPESEILELRADLEGLAARLAALKMTAADKEALKAQLVETERPVPTGEASQQELVVEATLEFHRMIHEGSKNPFVIRFLETLAPFDRTIRRRAILNPPEWQRDDDEHRAVVEAILRGDADEAELVMHEHVHRVIDLTVE
jgi:DNA-binding GntR family transcriptional regulator